MDNIMMRGFDSFTQGSAFRRWFMRHTGLVLIGFGLFFWVSIFGVSIAGDFILKGRFELNEVFHSLLFAFPIFILLTVFLIKSSLFIRENDWCLSASERQITRVTYEIARNKEMMVFFQPSIDLTSGAIVGGEALIRMNNRKFSPGEFIPIAERIGVIDEITFFVMEDTCRALRHFAEHDIKSTLSINVSGVSIENLDFTEKIILISDKNRIKPKSMIIEITEGNDIIDSENAKKSINLLKESGFLIAMDDFGHGYSSLRGILEIPYDFVKLDRSIVTGSAHDSRKNSLLKGAISISRSLEIEVIAEGLEVEDEATLLSAYGCKKAQGFLYSPPILFDDFSRLIMMNRRFRVPTIDRIKTDYDNVLRFG